MCRRNILRTVIAAAALSAALGFSACKKEYKAENEEQIESFLSDNGISVAGTPSCKSIYIPDTFGEVYENYNELQKKQGFDLSAYRSRDAEVYTYSVVSVRGEHKENTEAHIIVCDGIVIGGDVASVAMDGEMTGIIN